MLRKVLLFVISVLAATNPSTATLTPDNPSVSFTGGPFPASNPSDPLGENPPVCTDATCDPKRQEVSIRVAAK